MGADLSQPFVFLHANPFIGKDLPIKDNHLTGSIGYRWEYLKYFRIVASIRGAGSFFADNSTNYLRASSGVRMRVLMKADRDLEDEGQRRARRRYRWASGCGGSREHVAIP